MVRRVSATVATAAVIVMTPLLIVFLFTQRRRAKDPAQALYQRWLARLRKQGISTPSTEGPLALLARIKDEQPQWSNAAERVIRLYIEIRYGSPGSLSSGDSRLADLREAVSANIR